MEKASLGKDQQKKLAAKRLTYLKVKMLLGGLSHTKLLVLGKLKS